MNPYLLAIAAGAALALLLGSSTVRRSIRENVYLPLRQGASAVPQLGNARRMREGYLLGDMIEPQDVPALSNQGIRAVISLARPSSETVASLQRAGITWYDVPIYSSLPASRADQIQDVARRFRPNQIFIHCEHGADRTGNVAAFLLVTRHGWSISDALYAMVNPHPDDVSGLGRILAEKGIRDVRSEGDRNVSIYSGPRGGMKVRSGGSGGTGYYDLVRTTIDQMRRFGARS